MILQLIIKTNQISCLDQDGQYTDFIVGFKYPSSYDFNYMTDLMTELVDSDESMISDKSVFYLTLKQIYNETSPVGNRSQILLYNDQLTTNISVSNKYAHMKGVIAYDPVDQSGFWLTHSIPKYPAIPESSEFLKLSDLVYPNSGISNGQHLLCLSLDETNFLKVVEGLYYDRPYVFYSHITSDYQEKSIYLNSMSTQQREYNVSEGVSGEFDLQTKNKMNFKLYYKNKEWYKDLWSDLIAQDLGQNMYVNTWRHLNYDLPVTKNVTKICDIKACVETCKTWSSRSDHSKLGVTTNAEYTCFSDINFYQAQYKRGGGATCIRDVNLGQEMLRRTEKLIEGDSC